MSKCTTTGAWFRANMTTWIFNLEEYWCGLVWTMTLKPPSRSGTGTGWKLSPKYHSTPTSWHVTDKYSSASSSSSSSSVAGIENSNILFLAVKVVSSMVIANPIAQKWSRCPNNCPFSILLGASISSPFALYQSRIIEPNCIEDMFKDTISVQCTGPPECVFLIAVGAAWPPRRYNTWLLFLSTNVPFNVCVADPYFLPLFHLDLDAPSLLCVYWMCPAFRE